jgi:hypothetical protein
MMVAVTLTIKQALLTMTSLVVKYSTFITYPTAVFDVWRVTIYSKVPAQPDNTSNWDIHRKQCNSGMSAVFVKPYSAENYIFRNILENGILKGVLKWLKIMES